MIAEDALSKLLQADTMKNDIEITRKANAEFEMIKKEMGNKIELIGDELH